MAKKRKAPSETSSQNSHTSISEVAVNVGRAAKRAAIQTVKKAAAILKPSRKKKSPVAPADCKLLNVIDLHSRLTPILQPSRTRTTMVTPHPSGPVHPHPSRSLTTMQCRVTKPRKKRLSSTLLRRKLVRCFLCYRTLYSHMTNA